MSLVRFLAVSCVIALGSLWLFLWVQSQGVLRHSFELSSQVHEKALWEFTDTWLKSRHHALTNSLTHSPDAKRLAKSVLLAEASSGRKDLLRAIDQVATAASLDFSDCVWGPSSLRGHTYPLPSHAASQYFLKEIAGEPYALFPVELAWEDQRLATLILGTRLNGTVAAAVKLATRSTVEYSLGDGAVPLLRVNESPLTGLHQRTVISILGTAFVFLLLVGAGLAFFFHRYVLKDFHAILSRIDTAVKKLDQGETPHFANLPSTIFELRVLSKGLARLTFAIHESQKRLAQKTRTEALGEKAAQIAHDLKSPLLGLQTVFSLSSHRSQSHQRSIEALFGRIRSILKDAEQPALETCDLGAVVKTSVHEKTLQWSQTSFNPIFEVHATNDPIGVRVTPADLHRVLSNLLDNAVEAIEDHRTIQVHVERTGASARVRILDQGRGIPATIMEKLGTRGFSYQKPHGSGLGLWYAHERLKHWGGQLEIQPHPSRGTQVILILPITEPGVIKEQSA